MERAISINGGPEHNVRATRGRDSARIWIDGLGHVASLTKLGDLWEVRLDEQSAPIHVYAAGDSVTKGQSLVIIESMKMQTELFASRDGVVDRVTYRVGESFERNSPLVMLKPSAAEV